jgi:hypothetical protein
MDNADEVALPHPPIIERLKGVGRRPPIGAGEGGEEDGSSVGVNESRHRSQIQERIPESRDPV